MIKRRSLVVHPVDATALTVLRRALLARVLLAVRRWLSMRLWLTAVAAGGRRAAAVSLLATVARLAVARLALAVPGLLAVARLAITRLTVARLAVAALAVRVVIGHSTMHLRRYVG